VTVIRRLSGPQTTRIRWPNHNESFVLTAAAEAAGV